MRPPEDLTGSAGIDARGYSHPGYIASLAQFGVPTPLARSGGWLLERRIPGDAARDLMGAYPLFACPDWSGLAEDLADIGSQAVSVVLVADPLAGVQARTLERAFPDHVVMFKRHLVRDLDAPAKLPTHHRRHVRRSARAVDVEVCADPLLHLEEWNGLYAGLVERHELVGIRAFSPEAFRRQFDLPGTIVLRAELDGRTVGMTVWLESAPNAHYHLGAYSPAGYDVSASYALFEVALDHLRKRGVRLVDLGAAPGSPGAAKEHGLLRFKSGWANGELPAHLCGRVLDRSAYRRLVEHHAVAPGAWFPAYRAGDGDLTGRHREHRPEGVSA